MGVASPTASETFLDACLTAEGMMLALEGFAKAAGAEGATLTYSDRTLQLGVIVSPAHAEHLAAYVSERPHDPRRQRVNPTLHEGFRLDQDDFSDEELAADPFYQEFLRPRGLGWHACALLAGTPQSETVNLTLRRSLRQDRFQRSDLAALSLQLPLIRATAAIARMMGGILRPCDRDEERGGCLFGLHPTGAWFALRQSRHALDVLQARGGKLAACYPVNRAALARRSSALTPGGAEPRPSWATVRGAAGYSASCRAR